MRINFLSLLGIGFLALAVWRALRVRRDLALEETRWERALFGRRDPVSRGRNPVQYWCAIAVNAVIVLLIAIVAAGAFRLVSLGRH